jgi:stage II sporulation protein D
MRQISIKRSRGVAAAAAAALLVSANWAVSAQNQSDDSRRVSLCTLGSPKRIVVKSAAPIRVTDGKRAPLANGATSWTVAAGAGKTVTCEQPGGKPVQADTVRLEAAPGETLVVEGAGARRSYPGTLEFSAGSRGLQLVNDAPLEEYVRGVLSAEVPSTFRPEALKAMSIVVRTFALRAQGRHGAANLCDTTHCQVYPGLDRITAAHSEAVRATAGQVALYDGALIDSVYSADCGGRTSSNEAAWGTRPVPYLRSVADTPAPGKQAYCGYHKRHRWSLTLSPAQLRSLGGRGAGGPLQMEILATAGCGRVTEVQVAPTHVTVAMEEDEDENARDNSREALTSPRGVKRYTGPRLRQAIGVNRLPSLLFSTQAAGDGVVLEGTGYGHGVGLCQHGANGMAQASHSYDAILKHYYRGIEIGPAPRSLVARRR